ncbi:uncharacterized protein LOC134217024 [Armigeres subalbatus]|uniref:uncharacterized protein LOC134217024 n=1 Tax=Armigeres subalbatus TaxID=124917 RepID=UPI002ED0495A
MEALNLLWQLVVSIVIMKVAVAEECIRFHEHREEILACCNYTLPYSRAVFNQCAKPAAEKTGTNRAELLSCIIECRSIRLGLIVNNTLNLDKVSEYLQPMSEDVRSTVIAAYRKCDAKTTGSQSVCHSYAVDLEVCTLEEIHRQCPDELYNPSELCDKRRAGAEFCSR